MIGGLGIFLPRQRRATPLWRFPSPMPLGPLAMSEHNARYGWPHRRLRARLKSSVEAGYVLCWRCGRLIEAGQPWDLGHVDGDPTRYAGPEHRKCNRQTITHIREESHEAPRLTSREW